MARWLYAGAALTGWTGLAVQLALEIAKHGPLLAVWTMLGFFTIWTTILVSCTATQAALGKAHRPVLRYLALVSVLLVGVTYSLLLRNIVASSGWGSLANHLMHDVLPIVFALAWIADRHGALRWPHWRWALAFPVVYFAYAMVRGTLQGRYAYWFLDPSTLGAASFAIILGVLLGGVVLVSLGLIAVDRKLGAQPSSSRL